AKGVSNWLIGDIAKILNDKRCEINETALTPENLAEMVALIDNKTISNAAGKVILEVIIDQDKSPQSIVKEKGLAQISDCSALQTIVDDVISANEKAVVDYKAGKTNVVGFLVGQCMKASKGQGNPAMFKDMVVAGIEARVSC
ncbi:MAG: Asp-tRNA(Asn)/Glu-tRNA(Gln) amidotransferase GatCAB subunit B, partial [Oscillospiraceae bacterium]